MIGNYKHNRYRDSDTRLELAKSGIIGKGLNDYTAHGQHFKFLKLFLYMAKLMPIANVKKMFLQIRNPPANFFTGCRPHL